MSDASSLAAYVGYLYLAVASFSGAAMAPLTRDVETEASRYTYHVGRSFVSMLLAFGMIKSNGDSALGEPDNRKWFILVGVNQWFFLWGFVKAMLTLDSTTWAVVHFCTYPVFSVFFGRLITPLMMDTEQDDVHWGYFSYQLVRNAVTIFLMCFDLEIGNSASVAGIGWSLLTSASYGVATAVLRGIRNTDKSITVVLWSDAINLFLWLPPGVFNVRVDFLWPKDSNDNIALATEGSFNFSLHVWVCLILCGINGLAGMQFIGLSLQTLTVGIVSAFDAPLTILFCLAFDGILGVKQIKPLHLVGALLFILSMVAEAFFGFLEPDSKGSADLEDEERVPLTDRPDTSQPRKFGGGDASTSSAQDYGSTNEPQLF